MTHNPATGEPIATWSVHTSQDVERSLESAHRAFDSWRRTSFVERRERLRAAARLLRDRTDALAHLATLEMGKPIAESRAEVIKCAWACEYYAEHGESMLADEVVATDASRSWVRYEPLGAVLLIMPWNFPYWQVFRQLAPLFTAGNTCLLKHAPNVWGCAAAIANLVREAGFPDGVLENLRVDTDTVPGLIADARIVGVALTGSERAGRAVGAEAGRAIKPCVLELGGSDPFVVLRDADPDLAVEGAVTGRFLNSGQSCIAAKRLIVERPLAEAFIDPFVEAVRTMQVGDPVDPTTRIGPIARDDLRLELDRQVRDSIRLGATVRCGGTMIGDTGFYYAPTVLLDVRPGMPAFDEELFGPVAAVIVAEDADHAFELANKTRYGLGASVWTTSPEPERYVERLVAGSVMVNGIVKSDPRLPFGGTRASGVGRELGWHGIRAFTNTKAVWIR